jgi:hypothetical protein
MSGWGVLGAIGCPYFHQPHLFEVCDSICDALYFTSKVRPFDNVNSGQMFESLPTWTRMQVIILTISLPHLEHLQLCSVCDPAKIFFQSKFSYVLFCNPTNKTETGTANRRGTINNKPSGPIIMMGQSETLSSS